MGRPKKPEKTKPLRIPESFEKRVRRVALHQEKDPGDYLAERFAALLAEDEAKMFAEQDRERAEREKAAPKPKK